jgi:hypothetical protein
VFSTKTLEELEIGAAARLLATLRVYAGIVVAIGVDRV